VENVGGMMGIKHCAPIRARLTSAVAGLFLPLHSAKLIGIIITRTAGNTLVLMAVAVMVPMAAGGRLIPLAALAAGA